jgi:class 3 adenylate cyclase
MHDRQEETPNHPLGESDRTDLAEENLVLKRALNELQTLHEIAMVSARASGLQDVMRAIVQRVVKALAVDECVITLVSTETNSPHTLVRAQVSSNEKPRFSVADALTGWMLKYGKPFVSNDPQADSRLAPLLEDDRLRNVVSVPLQRKNRLIGLVTVFNKRSEPAFSKEDERLLSIIASQVGPILDRARIEEDRARIVAIFGQHVPAAVVDLLVRDGPDIASSRHHVCVMFLDLRGFSRYSESRSPEEVVEYLNALFSFMIKTVNRHHGIVHQLLGDGFLAVFGIPVKVGNESTNAVAAALEIIRELQDRVEKDLLPPTRLSIGIHAGQVVAGTVGAADRKEYKVTGDVVNVAARIEQMNRQFDSQLLISRDVWDGLDDHKPKAKSVGVVPVRGRDASIEVFRVV